jgi:hypothetical protein
MTLIVPPSHLTDAARRDWEILQASTSGPEGAERFDPAQAEPLPEPARRWVLHAIAPGTPLLRSVVLDLHGAIRLGAWHPFHAVQVLLPMSGYVWAAVTRLGPLTVRGFDRYRDGVGEMRWRMLDAVPIVSGGGPDIARSAAGRLACEFVLAPASALDPRVRWKPLDGRQAIAHVPVGEEEYEVTLTVAPGGRLEAVTVPRWGNPDKGPYRTHPFGVECGRESSFGGFTIPAEVRGGWWPGGPRWAEGEFIRFTVDHARYR